MPTRPKPKESGSISNLPHRMTRGKPSSSGITEAVSVFSPRPAGSTGWLDRLESDGCRLIIRSGSDSHIRIRLPEGARTPQANISFTTERDGTLSLALSADRDVVLTWESDKPRAGILP